MGKIILHITQRKNWETAQREGIYRTDSLRDEGFIHCSTIEQVVGTANLLFESQSGLVLLYLDTDKVKPEIKYENLQGGEDLFPHIYGPLNIDAVIKVIDLESFNSF